jgi:hypothetical protein
VETEDPLITNALLWAWSRGVANDSAYAIAQFAEENRGRRRAEELYVRRVARKSKAGYRWGTFRGMTLNRNVENTTKEPTFIGNSVPSRPTIKSMS